MLDRRHTNEAIIKASHMVMDAGIKLFTFNIVGFPRETKEQMLDTLRLNREIGPNTGVCTFFFPFPGTELFEISRLDGLLDGLNIEELPSNYNTRPIIPRTAKEKRDCIKVMNKMNAFFQWQNLKYNLREYRKDHGLPAVSLYFLRLLGFYGLQRIISHNNQLRIYNFVTKNSLLQPVFRVLMRGVR